MASAQVFETTELLEMILYKLPTKDLLLAQRVARQWKAVIDNSVKLQQALFFQAISEDPLSFIKPPHRLEINELNKLKTQLNSECLVNPLLDPVRYSMIIIDGRAPRSIEDTVMANRHTAMHSAFWYEEASWKRMLAIQPPIQNGVVLECFCNDRSINWYGDAQLEKIDSGTHCFMMDMIRHLDTQVRQLKHQGTHEWVDFYRSAHLDLGPKVECSEEFDTLIGLLRKRTKHQE